MKRFSHTEAPAPPRSVHFDEGAAVQTILIQTIPRKYYPDCFYTMEEVLQSRREQILELKSMSIKSDFDKVLEQDFCDDDFCDNSDDHEYDYDYDDDDDDDDDESSSSSEDSSSSSSSESSSDDYSDTSETADSSSYFMILTTTTDEPTWRGMEQYEHKSLKAQKDQNVQRHTQLVVSQWKRSKDADALRKVSKSNSKKERQVARSKGRSDQDQVFGERSSSSQRRSRGGGKGDHKTKKSNKYYKNKHGKNTKRRTLTQRATHKLSKRWNQLLGGGQWMSSTVVS